MTRAGTFALVGLGAFALALAALLAPLALPPGADPGQWLAMGRGGELTGPATAPPLVPAILRLLFEALPLGAALVATKLLAVALFAAVALASGFLAGEVAGPRARAWGFALAAANPLLALQVVIGAYPQLAALALALAGFAFLLRFEEGGARRDLVFIAVALALVAVAHPYTTVLVAIAAAGLLATALADRARARRVALALGLALVLALPMAAWHARLLGALKDYRATSPSTAGSVASALGHRFLEWPALFALAGVLLVGVVLAGRARDRVSARVGGALAAGAIAVFALAPFALTGRALLLGLVALGVVAAAGLARLPRRGALAVALVVALSAPVTLAGVALALPRHAPLGDDSLAAFDAIGRGDGAVLVASPWANADAWWLAGIESRRVLPADAEVWLVTREAVERSVDAKTVLAGVDALASRDARVVDGGNASRAANPELWAWNAFEFAPLLRVPDDGVEIVARADDGGADWLAAAGSANATRVAPMHFRLDGGYWTMQRLTRAAGNAVTIEWTPALVAPGATLATLRVPVLAGAGSRFAEVAIEGATARVLVENELTRATTLVVLTATSRGGASLARTGEGLAVEAAASSEGALALAIELRVESVGASATWAPTSAREILDRWSVTHVLARGENARLDARFERDPEFVRAFESGDDVRVWRRVAATA